MHLSAPTLTLIPSGANMANLSSYYGRVADLPYLPSFGLGNGRRGGDITDEQTRGIKIDFVLIDSLFLVKGAAIILLNLQLGPWAQYC